MVSLRAWVVQSSSAATCSNLAAICALRSVSVDTAVMPWVPLVTRLHYAAMIIARLKLSGAEAKKAAAPTGRPCARGHRALGRLARN